MSALLRFCVRETTCGRYRIESRASSPSGGAAEQVDEVDGVARDEVWPWLYALSVEAAAGRELPTVVLRELERDAARFGRALGELAAQPPDGFDVDRDQLRHWAAKEAPGFWAYRGTARLTVADLQRWAVAVTELRFGGDGTDEESVVLRVDAATLSIARRGGAERTRQVSGHGADAAWAADIVLGQSAPRYWTRPARHDATFVQDGSDGSTVGLFGDEAEARRYANQLNRQEMEWPLPPASVAEFAFAVMEPVLRSARREWRVRHTTLAAWCQRTQDWQSCISPAPSPDPIVVLEPASGPATGPHITPVS